MLIAQLTEAIQVVDKASAASDRWLFLAVLVILMAFGAAAIRWLIKSMETQNAAHATERGSLVAALDAKDKVHAAERKELVAEIKAEHLECRAARKEDQAAFLAAMDKKDAAVTQLITLVHAGKGLAP